MSAGIDTVFGMKNKLTSVRNEPVILPWADVQMAAEALADRTEDLPITGVYGIPRGGTYVAIMVANLLNLNLLEEYEAGCLVVDDLVDSGKTAREFIGLTCHFDALFRKPHSPLDVAPHALGIDSWIVFPWELTEESRGPEDSIRRILQHLGEDPTREGLIDTPKRVIKALRELTSGYELTNEQVLATTFDETCDEMVVVSGIEFSSMCEHHMLPFTGYATVAYIPNGQIVGLSKLARLVEMYAKRLQVQERMTEQIAHAIEDVLKPRGVGVIITSHHSCMGMRGVRKANARMTTSSLLGAIRSEASARAEFLSHHKD